MVENSFIRLFVYSFIALLSPPRAYAAEWTGCFEDIPGAEKVATIKCLEPLFQNTIGAVASLAVVGLFVILLVAGFHFLFSSGDQKKLEAAKGTLTAAIFGLVVIVSAVLILRTIAQFTGVDSILRFEIPKF